MKWHKLRHDCKPEEGKYVLVSFLIGDERLLYDCVVAKLGENEYGDTSWDDGSIFIRLMMQTVGHILNCWRIDDETICQ